MVAEVERREIKGRERGTVGVGSRRFFIHGALVAAGELWMMEKLLRCGISSGANRI